MRSLSSILTGASLFCLTTVSAVAAETRAEVPEPDTIALLTLACAGILIGRRWAAKRPPKD